MTRRKSLSKSPRPAQSCDGENQIIEMSLKGQRRRIALHFTAVLNEIARLMRLVAVRRSRSLC
jgi:hypothetical protein